MQKRKGELCVNKEFLEKRYHQTMLEFKTAVDDASQWDIRKQMANIERTALEIYGLDFLNHLRVIHGLETY